MGKETFKFYKRGKGELNTSNFPLILKQGSVDIPVLDAKYYQALALFDEYRYDQYLESDEDEYTKFKVLIEGYVHHMRADKDLVDPSKMYAELNYDYICEKVQHDSRNGINTAYRFKEEILKDLFAEDHSGSWYTWFIGADSSVKNFFSEVDISAKKVRRDGKVVALSIGMGDTTNIKRIIIVDDILGGGATVKMLVDNIRDKGYTGPMYLWTEYNEGIHSDELLSEFEHVYIGDTVGG